MQHILWLRIIGKAQVCEFLEPFEMTPGKFQNWRPCKRAVRSLLALKACAGLLSTARAQFIQQGGKLVGTGAVGNSQQGYSVALSADGTTVIVGGPTNAGAVWVFTRSAGVCAAPSMARRSADRNQRPGEKRGIALPRPCLEQRALSIKDVLVKNDQA